MFLFGDPAAVATATLYVGIAVVSTITAVVFSQRSLSHMTKKEIKEGFDELGKTVEDTNNRMTE